MDYDGPTATPRSLAVGVKQTFDLGVDYMVIPLPWYEMIDVWPIEMVDGGNCLIPPWLDSIPIDGEGNVVICLKEAGHDPPCGGFHGEQVR